MQSWCIIMKYIRKLITLIAFIVFVGCLVYLGRYYYDVFNTSQQLKNLQQEFQVEEKPQENNEPQAEPVDNSKERVASLRNLRKKNEDLIGWLEIYGTAVSYPVMQNEEFYLSHNFAKEKNINGLPMLDVNNVIKKKEVSDNLIIHGHHMKSGLIFGALMKFKDENYYKEHDIIRFDTLYEAGEYEIVSVFLSKIYDEKADTFKYYEFLNYDSEEEFDEFVHNVRSLGLYDTGVEPVYGDKFITLSTCEYTTSDGRMAIVARKIQK